MNTIRDLIKKTMKEQGISAYAIAKKIDSNQSKVHRTISGKSKFDDIGMLVKIAECLGVASDEGEMTRTPQVNFPHGTDKFKAYAEEVVASAGEQSDEPQTIRQRLGNHDYPPQVRAMADFLDLMTKDMTDEERDAFARELFEDTVRKLSGRKK